MLLFSSVCNSFDTVNLAIPFHWNWALQFSARSFYFKFTQGGNNSCISQSQTADFILGNKSQWHTRIWGSNAGAYHQKNKRNSLRILQEAKRNVQRERERLFWIHTTSGVLCIMLSCQRLIISNKTCQAFEILKNLEIKKTNSQQKFLVKYLWRINKMRL